MYGVCCNIKNISYIHFKYFRTFGLHSLVSLEYNIQKCQSCSNDILYKTAAVPELLLKIFKLTSWFHSCNKKIKQLMAQNQYHLYWKLFHCDNLYKFWTYTENPNFMNFIIIFSIAWQCFKYYLNYFRF